MSVYSNLIKVAIKHYLLSIIILCTLSILTIVTVGFAPLLIITWVVILIDLTKDKEVLELVDMMEKELDANNIEYKNMSFITYN